MIGLHWKLRQNLKHLKNDGLLNVLTCLILHADNTLRAWPKKKTIEAETDYGSTVVSAAIRRLQEMDAIILVPQTKRIGKQKRLPLTRNVYQLTGVLTIDGETTEYLHLSPEGWENVRQQLRDLQEKLGSNNEPNEGPESEPSSENEDQQGSEITTQLGPESEPQKDESRKDSTEKISDKKTPEKRKGTSQSNGRSIPIVNTAIQPTKRVQTTWTTADGITHSAQSAWDLACVNLAKILDLGTYQTMLGDATLVDFDARFKTFVVVIDNLKARRPQNHIYFNVIYHAVVAVLGDRDADVRFLTRADWLVRGNPSPAAPQPLPEPVQAGAQASL